MSAPLVVNLRDGSCWTRRGALRGGEALYALADVCSCPEYVMATLPELAEHGIVGSADVLPVPAGSEPQALTGEQRTTIAEQLADARPARDGLVVQIAEAVRDVREHEHPRWEDLYCLNLLSFMGERMGPVLRRLLDAEARVAELEAERHTTNEALSDAVEALRANRDRIADLETRLVTIRTEAIADVGDWLDENGQKDAAYLVYTVDIPAARDMKRVAAAEESADKLTQLLAPTQALREAGDAR
jgi:hypothetical protein